MADTAEDFKMTDDEARRIKQALKDKEFMDLLVEYAKEISDPENKKKYEEEIVAMERQRGQDVRLLKPQSGFVIKTVRLSDNMKVFLNICSSPEVKEYELQHVKGGANLSLPHSVSPVREDIDKGGKACIVYDVCFNPKSYDKGMKESNFRQSMVDSAFDTIERQMNIKLDRKNKKFPKLKYKGQARPLIIRPEQQSQQKTSPKDDKNSKTEKDSPLDFRYPDIQKENKATEEKTGKDKESEKCTKRTVIDEGKPVVPKYKIVHRGFFEMTDYTGGSLSSTTPKELVVEIELPLAKSANGLDLDIFAQQLILDSEKPSYHLDISLPHKVDEDRGKAQFDKSKKVLIVTLPILKAEPVTMVPNPPSRLVEECVDEKDVIHNGGHSPDSGIDEMCNHHQNDEEDAEVVEDADECVFQPSDLDNAVFETKNFESMPMNAQLPQYSFDQTIESVVVAVKVPNVKVENISRYHTPTGLSEFATRRF
ncbi:protein kintoun-like [Clytia hemisphaerica]|uniref:Protein kintoun n=1 Tax=Clytia hemisphaerica TaxID=252671 RepID=A0A7M5V6T1_9CNID